MTEIVMMLALTLSGEVGLVEKEAEPARVILDTDMGNDIDDVLALAMLHGMQSRKKAQILAITLTRDDELAVPFVDVINTFYGRPDIPVGIVRGGIRGGESRYLKMVKEDAEPRFPHGLKKASDVPDAVTLLRKTLAAQPDGSVVIIQIGFATNLARLLDSPGDQVSPLTGKELVARKVKMVSAMFGAYRPEGGNNPHKEFNVTEDIPSGKKWVENWPTAVVFSGFEVGQGISYPAESIRKDFSYVSNHPVVVSYRLHSPELADNNCWDLTSVLYAVFPERGYFGLSGPGKVTVKEDGATEFAPAAKGQHRFLTLSKEQAIRSREAFIQLASQPPEKLPAKQQPK